MLMKNSSDNSGIESATFRLVAQCLNQLRHRVPVTVLQYYLQGRTRRDTVAIGLQPLPKSKFGENIFCRLDDINGSAND